MKKVLFSLPFLALLGGCNPTSSTAITAASSTAITAAICTDAVTLQSSSIVLNANEKTALTGIISSCNATSGGTVFNNGTVAVAIINDAILLQGSGLFSDVHITAQAPEQQLVLRKIKQHWARYANYK